MISIEQIFSRWEATRQMSPSCRSFWYRLQQTDARRPWLSSPTDWGLYAGHAGVLVASLAFGEVSSTAKCLGGVLWKELISDMNDDRFATALPTTGWSTRTFHGLGGLLYLLALGSKLNGDQSQHVCDAALAVAHTLIRAETSESDLMDGHAGTLLAVEAAAAAGILPRSVALEVNATLIDKLAYQLTSVPVKGSSRRGWLSGGEGPLGGLAHGYAGIALALAHASTIPGTKAHRTREELLDTAVAGQMALLNRLDWTWGDLRPESPLINPKTSAWCHGGEGICLAILNNQEAWGLGEAELNSVIEGALTGVRTEGLSLCHGASGRAVLYNMAKEWSSEAGVALSVEAESIGVRVLAMIRACLELTPWTIEVEDLSLMTGLPGLLLASERPDLARAVLTLQIPALGEG